MFMNPKSAKEFWVANEKGENPGVPEPDDTGVWNRSKQADHLKHKATSVSTKHRRGRG